MSASLVGSEMCIRDRLKLPNCHDASTPKYCKIAQFAQAWNTNSSLNATAFKMPALLHARRDTHT
eukprot:3582092-Alexandrium_andersonii.AAC.1